MSNLILFGLLVVLLIAAQFTAAKTVEEVIEKYVKTRGGLDKLATVKSIYMEGMREVMGKEMLVKITKEQDKLSRTQLESDRLEGFILITPEEAWTYFPQRSPVINKVHEEDLSRLKTEMDIAGPLVDYIAKSHLVELLGKDTIEDNSCYKIRVVTKEGKEMMFWVDRVTYLLIQSSEGATVDGLAVKGATYTLYRNYKEVGGIKFAHTHETKTTVATTAATQGVITFHKIQLNPVIDPKMFLPAID